MTQNIFSNKMIATNQSFPYEVVSPESLGIPSDGLVDFIKELEDSDYAMHSFMILRHGKLCLESYYAPFTRDTLHRMFSITKSLTSIAIGLLQEEGKLNITDYIYNYFPEKLPADFHTNNDYEYLRMLTIENMLTMRTCHSQTTYKATGVTDWVGSFFTTKPDHVPGTMFSYDTSSTHTLCALVEKLSGMEMLDYLRSKCLDEIGFSKEAFVLKDPNGVSMGGSGLCATPLDILKIFQLVVNEGEWNGKQLLPRDYIKAAVCKHSDPYGKSAVIEEMQGYGYQIWRSRYNGYMFYGMGGQLALYMPDKDIIMMTTADVQGRQGGVQAIYDSFFRNVFNRISDNSTLPENKDAHNKLLEYASSRKLIVVPGLSSSHLEDSINGKTYHCANNKCGITSMCVNIEKNGHGEFHYINATGSHVIPFAFGENIAFTFDDYNKTCVASAAWKVDNNLLIKVQIIDDFLGNMYISLNFRDNYVTAMLRKIEESLFKEYDGIVVGKQA